MTQDAKSPDVSPPERSSGDAALHALVRTLARMASEKDYAMQRGAQPPDIAPEPESRS